MLVVRVDVRVLLERMGDFLAAALASARESAKFVAVFPAGDEGRKSGSR